MLTRNVTRSVKAESLSNVRKGPSGIFSRGELKLLVEVYEVYKHIITQKGNIVTINKYREAIWQIKSQIC
jgi:hypothetical protein